MTNTGGIKSEHFDLGQMSVARVLSYIPEGFWFQYKWSLYISGRLKTGIVFGLHINGS